MRAGGAGRAAAGAAAAAAKSRVGFFVTVAVRKDCSFGERRSWFRVALLSIQRAFAPAMFLNAPPTKSPYH